MIVNAFLRPAALAFRLISLVFASAPLLRVSLGILQRVFLRSPLQPLLCMLGVHVVLRAPPSLAGAATFSAPPLAHLAWLTADQRLRYPRVWDRLPPLSRMALFNLQRARWITSVIGRLGDVLRKFPDVISMSKGDIGSCSLVLFEICVPPDNRRARSRPYRVNPIWKSKSTPYWISM